MEPDESVLRKYLLGELDDEQAAWVSRCLERNPALADTLENLARADTLLSALRGARAAAPDPPQVAEVIDRAKQLVGPAKATDTVDRPQHSQPSAETPVGSTATGARKRSAPPTDLPALKGYRVLRLVGTGGMGMVYEAVDETLDRRVALKVMRPEIAADPNVRARFVREAKAVARLEHDHVVPIFHINEGDCPFLAMPFLKGEPLDKYIERFASAYLPIDKILKIARETALGLAAVHAQGLIHRDIKPGNLWLERLGDSSGWRVKIVDFGLARFDGEANEGLTQLGAIVGTPAFMAPEQARGGRVDARADLFSLGSVLYLLTTGRPPFGRGSVLSVLTALAVETPTPVREINPTVPEALSGLIGNLLAKDPAKRPASATAVAEALRAIEASLKPAPVVLPLDGGAPPDEEWAEVASSDRAARAPSGLRRALFVWAAVASVVLCGGGFAAYKLVFETKYGQIVVEVNDPEAEVRFKNGELHILDKHGEQKYALKPSEKNKELPVGEYLVQVTGADGLALDTKEFKIKKGEVTTIRVTATAKPLAGAKAPNPAPTTKEPNAPAPALPPALPVPAPSAELLALRRDQIPPDVLAAVGRDDPLKAPEALVGALGVPKPTHREPLLSIAYSPDGRWLATGGFDKLIILYDAETGVARRTLLGHTAGVFTVTFTKDSKTLVSASIDGTIRLWPVNTDAKPAVVDTGLGPMDWVAMALSRDDELLAVGTSTGKLRLWKFGDWAESKDITDLEKKVAMRTLCFSPDGKLLAAGGLHTRDEEAEVFVFRADTRKLDSTWATESRCVVSARFSRDGKKLAATGGPGRPRGMARIWDLETKKVVFDVQQFRDYAHALELDPDAKHLIVCNGDAGLTLYETATQKRVAYFSGWFGDVLRSVAYSPDGKSVAFGTHDGGLLVWDAMLTKQKYLDRGPRHLITSIAVKPDGTSVVVTTTENTLYRIDLADPRTSRVVAQYQQTARSAVFSPDGSKYAVTVGTYAWEADTIFIHDSATDKVLHSLKAPGYMTTLSFTPDGASLMASGHFHAAVLYDAAKGEELYRFSRKDAAMFTHAVSADGKSVVLANRFSSRVVLLNLETGNEIRLWECIQNVVPRACAYDPRGRYVALGETDKTITLWDVQTGKLARTLSGHTAWPTALQFTPDGASLISTGSDGTLRVWNPDALRVKAVIPVGPDKQHLTFALDRSGRFAFVAGGGGLVSVLKLP